MWYDLTAMKNQTIDYFRPKQGILPMFISDFLDICDPVLTFDEFMEGIDLDKYLKNIPVYETGRIRYNPVNMLKTVPFGFMTKGYMSLRELEDNCKVNIRFMYLMDNEKPSYRTFGYFINEVLADSIEEIFNLNYSWNCNPHQIIRYSFFEPLSMPCNQL